MLIQQAIVAYGDVETIHDRVRRHFEAGADHVCIQVLTTDPTALPDQQRRELAPALRQAATAPRGIPRN
ncbi:hypothetical protein FF36_04982 [Frankia torreyi]|uniref:Luciferase-like monooxygenase n=1 Tax=Frankia torreyi TaxID=1856 RepID=A0A0D8B9C3_9ACTN|nr:hypothetical protein FF36_04982 [Frankia torreyi]KQM02999.1 hypothetical protein FF86_105010 [Frankia sp. CpI1-P]